MQQVISIFGDKYRILSLPDAHDWLMPGVRWGCYEHALTPAFWVSTAWMHGDIQVGGFQLGDTLAEETAACLLGGHGLPAEVGLAAFARVRDELRATKHEVLSHEVIERLLTEPLTVCGRQVRYRFARQKARYLSGSLAGLRRIDEHALDDVELRDALCALPGIGLKTASWIVRNRRASDHIAVLDVHIVRACQIMNVFPEHADPNRNYIGLERRFLEFCKRANVRASIIDAVMWGTMRKLSKDLLNFLVDPHRYFGENLSLFQTGEFKCREVAAHEATGRRTRGQARIRRGTWVAEVKPPTLA